jgi:hypothetical protein
MNLFLLLEFSCHQNLQRITAAIWSWLPRATRNLEGFKAKLYLAKAA